MISRRNYFSVVSSCWIALTLVPIIVGAPTFANALQEPAPCLTGPVSFIPWDDIQDGTAISSPEQQPRDNEFNTRRLTEQKEASTLGGKIFHSLLALFSTEMVTAIPSNQHHTIESTRWLQFSSPPADDDASSSLYAVVRPCLCAASDFGTDYYGDDDSSQQDFTLYCPASADYCGLTAVSGGSSGPVGCYSKSVPLLLARNAWPMILLWFTGVLALFLFTVHGRSCRGYVASCFSNQCNETEADRLLADDGERRPASRWNFMAWQLYRLDHNIMARTNWFVQQDFNVRSSNQQPTEGAVFQIKTMTFQLSSEKCQVEQDEDPEQVEDDNEPTCSICLVPLQNGDIVGDLPCRHLYHKECLKTWCRRKNACPLCTAPLATRANKNASVTEKPKQLDDYDVEQGLSQVEVESESPSPFEGVNTEVPEADAVSSDGSSSTDGTSLTDDEQEDME